MAVSPLSSVGPAAASARVFTPAPSVQPTPADIKKAAQQFEAILMRQLLKPAVEPLLNSSIAGEGGQSGAGTYSYLLTDTLATSMTQGGGLGLARVLERQMTPAATAPHASSLP